MARAYRHFSAGEGDSVLVGEGGRSVHKWISEIDNPLDNPFTKLIEANPIHSNHPDPVTFPGTVVIGYSRGEHLSPEAWEMFVHYGPITDEVLGQWFRTGSMGHEATELRYSVTVKTPNGQFVESPSRLIAQPEYAEIPADGVGSNAPPVAKTDSVYGTELKLRHTGYYLPRPQPTTLPVGPKSYTITVPQLSAYRIALISKWLGKTNSQAFILDAATRRHAYDRWELLFDGFEHVDFPLAFGSTGRSGAAAIWWTRATLHFLYGPIHPELRPFGWRGTRLWHEFVKEGTSQVRRVLRLAPLPGNQNDPVNTDMWEGINTKDDMDFRNIFLEVAGFVPNF